MGGTNNHNQPLHQHSGIKTEEHEYGKNLAKVYRLIETLVMVEVKKMHNRSKSLPSREASELHGGDRPRMRNNIEQKNAIDLWHSRSPLIQAGTGALSTFPALKAWNKSPAGTFLRGIEALKSSGSRSIPSGSESVVHGCCSNIFRNFFVRVLRSTSKVGRRLLYS
ncbi:hypothetical protein NE237_032451 [Protea cynaroides]|uniref:Uncharacterized protein n=1 Tax=Protea cynaroides TaxID=273540 RepID=A0A9Q0R3E8_9MAGN|nr:hypothetical protein NE237_032451 [Protea cynaroides]